MSAPAAAAALPQLPAVAMRLPPHLQHLHQQESGGSGGTTPLSARSVGSAWSDSGEPLSGVLVVVWVAVERQGGVDGGAGAGGL
jgi:hypothetical protein